MKLRDIERLIEILEKSNLTEIEWTEEQNSIILKKEKEIVMQSAPIPQPLTAPTLSTSHSTPNTDPTNNNSMSTTDGRSDLYEFKSPMVGSFYCSPSPSDPAFVKVGDKVSNGTVCCIIEAMKLMNEIELDVSGTIEEICIQDGVAIEFGTVLFRIKKD